MLTKDDANKALEHLSAWDVHPGDLNRDSIARFISEVRDLLPTHKEAVAQIKREYSAMFPMPAKLTEDQIRAIGDAWSRK